MTIDIGNYWIEPFLGHTFNAKTDIYYGQNDTLISASSDGDLRIGTGAGYRICWQ